MNNISIDSEQIERLIAVLNHGWIDYLSALSVPILTLAALVITYIFSRKQVLIAEYEYRYRLYIRKNKLFVIFAKALYTLKYKSGYVGDVFDELLIKEENLFIFGQAVEQKFKELKDFVESTNKAQNGYIKERYTEEEQKKLEGIVLLMKKDMEESLLTPPTSKQRRNSDEHI
ncbi:hypothetical protein FACS1894139_16650 [Planctomycetales bacterium]|nr:hypothetical protein FACS1894107_04830 [Planctomycetales bacterium]GHT07809.1 hypothetical protein FACS1894139_16650 [Planctomycetales bacterium]